MRNATFKNGSVRQCVSFLLVTHETRVSSKQEGKSHPNQSNQSNCYLIQSNPKVVGQKLTRVCVVDVLVVFTCQL
jgi:hypothetical protein